MRRQARGARLEGPGEGPQPLPCGRRSGCCVLCCAVLCPPFPLLPASSPAPLGPQPVPLWMHGLVPGCSYRSAAHAVGLATE